MKKILLVIIFVLLYLASISGSEEEGVFQLQLNVGIDLKGNHDRFFSNPWWEDESVLLGFSPSFEIINESKYFDIGIGFEYQLEREIKDSDGAKFSFMPIYALGRLTLIPTKNRELEAIGHIGYNFFNFNEKYLTGDYASQGNLYWAAGLSLVLGKRIVMQALYKENKAIIDYNNTSAQVKNTHISVGLGLRL